MRGRSLQVELDLEDSRVQLLDLLFVLLEDSLVAFLLRGVGVNARTGQHFNAQAVVLQSGQVQGSTLTCSLKNLSCFCRRVISEELTRRPSKKLLRCWAYPW